MNRFGSRVARIAMAGAVVILLSIQATPASSPRPAPADVSTTKDVSTTEIAPNIYMLSVPAANAIVVADELGCLYAGVQLPPLIGAAKALAGRLNRQFRYAVIAEDDAAARRRDGGWGESGVITIAQESLNKRMQKSPQHDAGTAMPTLGFSNVVQLFLKNEEVHLIHEHSGYSNSDIVVHVEKAGVLYTGGLFTSDGYPAIRPEIGGSVSDLSTFAKYFIRNFHDNVDVLEPIVPGRGPVAKVQDLYDYRLMLMATHERISEMMARPLTLEEIQKREPTREFDARWGHGPVSPAEFTAMVYESIKKDQEKNAPPATMQHNHGGAAPATASKP
jgi:glyoxylase-like metal-dependent hydrolase (beta-lactamase superfamily II)